MSLVLKYNESFLDSLFNNLLGLFDIILKASKFVTAIGFVIATFYLFYRIYEHCCKRFTKELKCNLLELQMIRNYNRLLVRERSIIGHKEMLKALEDAADECYKKACALKCIDIIVHCPQLLNTKSSSGLTPFHRVCLQGNKFLIAFMLAKGADPTLVTKTGENALCMAIYYFLNNPTDNDFSCLEMLAEAGCRLASNDKSYNRLLKIAIRVNHTKLVQWLVLHQKNSMQNILRCSSTPLM